MHLVDELVCVILESQRGVEDAQPAEYAEQVVVAPEEHVQSHLDVVPVPILPAAHLQMNSIFKFENNRMKIK